MPRKRIRRKWLQQRGPDPSDSKKQLLPELIASVSMLRSFIEPILEEAFPPGRRGRPPGYLLFGIFLALLLRTQSKSLRGLCRLLARSEELLRLTGLHKVPPHQTFSNYVNRLGEDRFRRISEVIVQHGLKEYWPEFGKVLSIDGTVQKAKAKNDQGLRSTSDPDARWGYKEHVNTGEPKFEFGYRPTIVSDAQHETPITCITRPANASECKLYPSLLKKAHELGLPFEVVVTDGLYDSKLNIAITSQVYKAAPIIPINTRSSKSAKLTGTRRGDVMLPIRRNSDEWKRYQRMRVASEHVNRALKEDLGLSTLRVRTLPRVACFVWLCIIMKQLCSLSAARLGREDLARYVMVWCH